jgi:hypothetical protein
MKSNILKTECRNPSNGNLDEVVEKDWVKMLGNLLESECLCLPKIHTLKLNPQYDSSKKWGFWD